jgi:hypothetical protein
MDWLFILIHSVTVEKETLFMTGELLPFLIFLLQQVIVDRSPPNQL